MSLHGSAIEYVNGLMCGQETGGRWRPHLSATQEQLVRLAGLVEALALRVDRLAPGCPDCGSVHALHSTSETDR